MERETELVMECIKCHIFSKPIDRAFFERFSAEEWGKAYALAKRHDLVHLLCDFAIKNKLLADERFAKAFEEEAMSAAQRFIMQNYELEQIRDVLEQKRIPFVVLKGPVIRKLYPEEWMRTSADIDVLVEAENVEKAENALNEMLDYTVDARGYHHNSLYAPSGVHMELHFSVLEHQEPIDVVLKDVWQYTQSTNDSETERQLTPEFFVFQIAAHMSHHFLSGGCGIRPFIDLKLILEKRQFDREILNDLLRKAKLDSFFANAKLLSEIWFGNDRHTALTRQMEEYVLCGGVYGTLKNHVLSVQSEKSRMKALLSRIFLPYPDLCQRYSGREIKKAQVPLYQVKRWIDVIREGSFSKGVYELRLHATADQTEIDGVSRMLSALQLERENGTEE